MKRVGYVAMIPLVAASLVACGDGNTAGTSAAQSAVEGATSAASSAASSAMSTSDSMSTTDAMSPSVGAQGGGEVSVEVDGAAVEGDFMPVTCVPGDSDGMPELKIEGGKPGMDELDVDINNPDQSPMLDSLDLHTANVRLDTEEPQEAAAKVELADNTWMIETEAFHEGTQDVAKVNVKVSCPT
ncbi:MAG: lipoprotein LpqH [Corynebacterium sp.]|nr:lipoprotein LpqH [Corynebacterium sp.]